MFYAVSAHSIGFRLRWRRIIRRTRRTPTPTAGANSAQVRFGDAPADSVIALKYPYLRYHHRRLAAGAPVSVAVPAGNRIELTHASGKFEPFIAGNLPQGTFSAANLTLVNSELTFLSSTGTAVHINGPASASITVPLSPNSTIGAARSSSIST